MFKFEELCELVRLVGSSEIGMVEIEHAGGRLRIEGMAPIAAAPVTMVAASSPQAALEDAAAPSAAPPAPNPDDPGDAVPEDNLHYVTSPIVGTFYRAPNPDADPYVKVGDPVDGGKTLCIIEAMKLMNEIESDQSGTIVKVFPENAQPVEFGERLFAIKVS
jgi:acetyl-CoA carboxylase biotin carboxyl carrier protein